ncbi:hypothetical protein O181_016290 [Austropuccinia psidii MF-1]|uniref:Uncharacterized protein n=1 Tax=Austropuccinia psidii MF-1 TaxID=1389203 RepID=A0A9Q3GRT2_9BASI|nr:hypothetical protein [Austropuccinia psidii MF-1]
MRELTSEKYSDSLRVLDLKTGKIKVTRDYTVSHFPVSSAIQHPENTLPHEPKTKLILKFPRQIEAKDYLSPVHQNLTKNLELTTMSSVAKAKDKHYE